MRPNVEVPDSDQYECTSCGARVPEPETKVCPDCGGEVRNLALSRDL